MDLMRILASAPRDHDLGEKKPLYTPWGQRLHEAAQAAEASQEAAQAAEAAQEAAQATEAAQEAAQATEVAQEAAQATEAAQAFEATPRSEHPRPQFARKHFHILNGWWNYAILRVGSDRSVEPPASFDGRIRVPFSPEALLSGVEKTVEPDDLLWYERTFNLPKVNPGERCLLHFEAVDFACACLVNGQMVGTHEGGYLPFTFDITDALLPASARKTDLAVAPRGKAQIALCVWDPSDTGVQLRGKQKLESGGIWYPAQSGIWQPVWFEIVPNKRVLSAQLEPQGLTGELVVNLEVTDHAGLVRMYVTDAAGMSVASVAVPAEKGQRVRAEGQSARRLTLHAEISHPHAWSPDNPYLYYVTFRFGSDVVESYTAFRTIEMVRSDEGRGQVLLNGEPLFLKGVLDQGYWSDGLMTAPSDEAHVYDIQAMKQAGFNMLRKHIKVEADRWYYHCDRLGMLVFQDMVTGGEAYSAWQTSFRPTLNRGSWGAYDDTVPAHQKKLGSASPRYQSLWKTACHETIRSLRNHPSVVCWVLFNEGWGQFNTRAITEEVHELDPTRLIDAVSGWYDQKVGDFLSVHNYFRALKVYRETRGSLQGYVREKGVRAFAISEFGGAVYAVSGHSSYAGSYGYGTFSSLEEWQTEVRRVLAQVDGLESRGLAAYVYTQLSDVEEETNGLLSYDRRVNKLVEGEGVHAGVGECAGGRESVHAGVCKSAGGREGVHAGVCESAGTHNEGEYGKGKHDESE